MEHAIGHLEVDPPLDDDLPSWTGWTCCRHGCCLLPGDDLDLAGLREVVRDLRALHRVDGMVVARDPIDIWSRSG